MKRLGLTPRVLYRFPIIYLAVLATSALTWRLMPPAGIPYVATLICSLLFTVILLYSAARVLIIFEKREHLYQGEKTEKEKLVFLLHHPETRLFLLLFLLLPLPLPAFQPLFGAFSPIIRYLLSRLFFPFLVIAFLLGSLAGLHYYEKNEKKGEKRKKISRAPIFFFFHVFKYVPIYAVASYCLLALTVVLVSIPGIVMLFLTTGLGVTVIVVLATVWIVFAIRGVKKRKIFLEQLKNASGQCGIFTPEIREPIRSLFRRKEKGTIFEFSIGKRKYACRLIGVFNPFTLYRFYPDGMLGHVHILYTRMLAKSRWGLGNALYKQQIELWETKREIGFEAEEGVTKIFIFNPCSKLVEGAFANENLPLDNGMKIGEYTFYTATGFTNALARNCLHRKQNE